MRSALAVLGVWFAAVLLSASYSDASAQVETSVTSLKAAPATREPERFAFVIGNARYQKSGTLSDLPDACAEARSFRQRLLEIGWREDHLYPLVGAPVTGETPEDAVDRAICNKTGREIDQQLGDFMSNLAISENNPYGVVYFAGHGAQSNGEFYGFGVDAVVNPEWERSQLTKFDTYEVFSRPSQPGRSRPPAVNLSRAASIVQGPNGRALLMIIDACRNDPILDHFSASQPTPSPGISKEAMNRLWITYIGGMQAYERELSNVMILFASRSGKKVQSGKELDPNWFVTHLMAYMSKETNLTAGTASFVNDFEVQAANEQRVLPVHERQIPSHIGRMASKPIFCFKGCAQPLDAWSTERMEIVPPTPAPAAARKFEPEYDAAIRQGRPLHVAWHPSEQVAFPMSKSVSMATNEELNESSSTPAFIDVSAQPTGRGLRPINLDVFYCVGDSLASVRQTAARDFALRIRQDYPRDHAVDGTYLDNVRLRSLPSEDNMKLDSPRVGKSLVVVASDPASPAWSERIGAAFARTYSDNVTKGMLRAYFCDGFAAVNTRPTVYPHVAHARQLAAAQKTVQGLAEKLPEFSFTRIEAVQDGHPTRQIGIPKRTELRCYGPGACERAPELAVQLAEQVTGPMRVVRLEGPQVANVRRPIIELWFGEQQLAGWDAAEHR